MLLSDTTFSVDSSSMAWTNSGVLVASGAYAVVTVTGNWIQGDPGAQAYVFPEGTYNTLDPNHAYDPAATNDGASVGFPTGFACSNCRVFSLVMAARTSPPPVPPSFGISDGLQPDRGPTTFLPAQVGGKRLWFVVNDKNSLYGDNVGSLTVNVKTYDSPPPTSVFTGLTAYL